MYYGDIKAWLCMLEVGGTATFFSVKYKKKHIYWAIDLKYFWLQESFRLATVFWLLHTVKEKQKAILFWQTAFFSDLCVT